MRIWKLASVGALGTALRYAPFATALLVALVLVAAAAFLYWFARQSEQARADVIQLIRALRGE